MVCRPQQTRTHTHTNTIKQKQNKININRHKDNHNTNNKQSLASELGQLVVARQIKKTPTSELGLRSKPKAKNKLPHPSWDYRPGHKSSNENTHAQNHNKEQTKHKKENIHKHETNNNKHNSSFPAGTTSGCKTNQENTIWNSVDRSTKAAQKKRKQQKQNTDTTTPTSELGLRRKQQPKTNSHIRAGTAGCDKNRTTKSPTHTTKTKGKQNINKHENNNKKHNSSISAGTASGCKTNQENTGWTSVDRSTKATLSTYNTWIQLRRLQKIYHSQSPKLRFTTNTFNSSNGLNAIGQILILVMWQW